MAVPKKAHSTKPRNDLTAEYVRSILRYNRKTGAFHWRVDRGFKVKAGTIAGGRSKMGYVQIAIDKHRYLGHRLAYLIITGRWPTHQIDHKNVNRNDDTWKNIRPATQSQNRQNQKLQRNNTTGFKGIVKCGNCERWYSRIQINNKTIYIGIFTTPEEASAAYKKAANKYFGKFARFK